VMGASAALFSRFFCSRWRKVYICSGSWCKLLNSYSKKHICRTCGVFYELLKIVTSTFSRNWNTLVLRLAWAWLYFTPSPASSAWNLGVSKMVNLNWLPRSYSADSSSFKSLQFARIWWSEYCKSNLPVITFFRPSTVYLSNSALFPVEPAIYPLVCLAILDLWPPYTC
jgi:hypothetical protein